MDPGVSDLGLARIDNGEVTGAWWVQRAPKSARCGRCLTDCEHASQPLQRASMVQEAVRAAGGLATYGLLVIEWPQVYMHHKAPPADLVNLAAVAGGIATLAYERGVTAWQTSPSGWKGMTKKDVFQMQILACLHGHELERLPRQPRTGRFCSDAVDAVGLGLWAVGRLHRYLQSPRVFANQVEPVRARPRAPKAAGALPLFNPRTVKRAG